MATCRRADRILASRKTKCNLQTKKILMVQQVSTIRRLANPQNPALQEEGLCHAYFQCCSHPFGAAGFATLSICLFSGHSVLGLSAFWPTAQLHSQSTAAISSAVVPDRILDRVDDTV